MYLMPANYRVELDVYRGANIQPEYRTSMIVDADTPLGALRKAEDHTNVMLELLERDDFYAASRSVSPVVDPRPAASVAMAGLAEAA